MRFLEITDPLWAAFLEGQSGVLPYHHPSWAELVARTYGYRAFALVLEDAGGNICAGAPVAEIALPLRRRRKWTSLPFTDFCPPVSSDHDALGQLAAACQDALGDAGVERLEIRAEIGNAGFRQEAHGFRHVVTLASDPAEVHAKFHRSQVKRGIKKAQGSGLRLRRGSSREDVSEVFYDLHLRTRQRQGTPVQPRRFFQALWDQMLAKGLGFAMLAYEGDRAVAGAIFLTWKNELVYKYAASDRDAWNLRPNHLICWDAIRWGCENGYRSFDFGRTDADNSGLRSFKLGWGVTEHPLVYSTVGSIPSHRNSPSLLRRSATKVIQRSPAWVCRVTGELLYKYSA